MKKEVNEVQGQIGLEAIKVFSTTGHAIDLIWLSPMNSNDVGHFLLICKKNNLASDIPTDFKIFLWMPSMGHGSSPVTINKIATGIYDVTDVYFIMDGDWQIKVQLKNGTSILEELKFSYSI
jgi:hypothetical protein